MPPTSSLNRMLTVASVVLAVVLSSLTIGAVLVARTIDDLRTLRDTGREARYAYQDLQTDLGLLSVALTVGRQTERQESLHVVNHQVTCCCGRTPTNGPINGGGLGHHVEFPDCLGARQGCPADGGAVNRGGRGRRGDEPSAQCQLTGENAILGIIPDWLVPGLAGGGALALAIMWVTLIRQNRRLDEQARLAAVRAEEDPLTGLLNRLSLEREAGELLAHGDATLVAVIDVDDFKRINDRVGHAGGDRVLIEIAARLRAQARPGDLLARVGGDEFAVVLRAADQVTARNRQARLRYALSGSVAAAGRPVSVSVGCARLLGSFAESMHAADVAMYARNDTKVDEALLLRSAAQTAAETAEKTTQKTTTPPPGGDGAAVAA